MESKSTVVIDPHSCSTIAAIATPPGRGGVGVIRISGPQSRRIAQSVTQTYLKGRYAHLCDFMDHDGGIIDQGLAIFFPNPNSYTGEDVLELQGHGGPIVLDLLLKRVLDLGCRIAKPGEFTERAFLNGKMDLTQAEAVSDLIESGSIQAATASVQSMQGVFSSKINILLKKLIELRVYIESSLDFSEEEIDFLVEGDVLKKLEELGKTFVAIKEQARQGKILKEGMRVVIAGEPNVGKSSLLNTLTGNDSAIVTDVPGTTRDVLREQIHIDGMPLHIIDTAGIRISSNIIEQEGIRRAYEEVEKADRVLLLSSIENVQSSRPDWVHPDTPVDFVINKIDLSSQTSRCSKTDSGIHLYISVKTGEGVDKLRDHLKESVGYDTGVEGKFIARRRHLTSLGTAESHVLEAISQLKITESGELAAQELRYAQDAVNEITGEFTSDDLLGEIFSSFCIGK